MQESFALKSEIENSNETIRVYFWIVKLRDRKYKMCFSTKRRDFEALAQDCILPEIIDFSVNEFKNFSAFPKYLVAFSEKNLIDRFHNLLKNI